jgi:PAS domain S-box-containing protein
MKSVLFIRQTPFHRQRLIVFTVLATLLALFAVYQLSQLHGWAELHQKAPLIILLELLPVILFSFLIFSTSRKFHEDTKASHENSYQSLITSISDTLGKIKSGTYDKENDQTGEPVIDGALRDIYDKFKADADNERHRSWANEGLALFREIMGAHTEIKPMCEELISTLVKYVGANQGGVFILNAESKLELTACYAFERKKYLTRTVDPGEGLIGQCFVERQRIYMTKVPDQYITITSGLGAANPSSILILPLKLKDAVVGVLELASFKPYSNHRLDFIDKAAEALAQSISSIQVSEDTKNLLGKSLQREQELKDQEERVRQNMEELYVTQEDMRKINLEMEELFKAIDSLTATMELNRQGEITKLNDRFLQTLSFTAQDLYSKPLKNLLSKQDDNARTFSSLWQEVLEGKSAEKVLLYEDAFKKPRWLRTGFYPLKGKDGIDRIICFLTDISEIKLKELELDEVNQNTKAYRNMLTRILNEVPLKIFLKQYDGKFLVVNDAVSRFHGFDTPDGLTGKSDADFYPPKDAAEWLEAEHKIIREGRTEYIHEDGGKMLQTVKMPFYIDSLKETGLLGFQADVTELEQLRKRAK